MALSRYGITTLPVRARPAAKVSRRAFTLVELLVVVGIVGVLVSLLLPAVQYSREAARRASCQNNIKNQALALQLFHDVHNHFPYGRNAMHELGHSWCTYVLPYLEQGPVADQIHLERPFDDPEGNLQASTTVLPIFRCPSSLISEPGDTDYAGMMGSILSGLNLPHSLESGTLLNIKSPLQAVRFGDITDGASSTIALAESSDRRELRWADGYNIISHDNGAVNTEPGEIFSRHRSGAFVGRADGGVSFLSHTTDRYVIGSLCTRSGNEVIPAQFP